MDQEIISFANIARNRDTLLTDASLDKSVRIMDIRITIMILTNIMNHQEIMIQINNIHSHKDRTVDRIVNKEQMDHSGANIEAEASVAIFTEAQIDNIKIIPMEIRQIKHKPRLPNRMNNDVIHVSTRKIRPE